MPTIDTSNDERTSLSTFSTCIKTLVLIGTKKSLMDQSCNNKENQLENLESENLLLMEKEYCTNTIENGRVFLRKNRWINHKKPL